MWRLGCCEEKKTREGKEGGREGGREEGMKKERCICLCNYLFLGRGGWCSIDYPATTTTRAAPQTNERRKKEKGARKERKKNFWSGWRGSGVSRPCALLIFISPVFLPFYSLLFFPPLFLLLHFLHLLICASVRRCMSTSQRLPFFRFLPFSLSLFRHTNKKCVSERHTLP